MISDKLLNLSEHLSPVKWQQQLYLRCFVEDLHTEFGTVSGKKYCIGILLSVGDHIIYHPNQGTSERERGQI